MGGASPSSHRLSLLVFHPSIVWLGEGSPSSLFSTCLIIELDTRISSASTTAFSGRAAFADERIRAREIKALVQSIAADQPEGH